MALDNPSGSKVSEASRGVPRGVLEGDRKQGSVGGCSRATTPTIGKGMCEGEGLLGEKLLGWGIGG